MLEPVTDIDDTRLSPFRDLKEAELAARDGMFIAEGRLILRVLLDAGRWEPACVLVSPAALESLQGVIDPGVGLLSHPHVPVLLAEQPLIERTAGFALHRGCVAAVRRPPVPDIDGVLRGIGPGPACVALLEGVNNHDNIGGIFRNAAAFGLDAVLLTPDCADPLYRKAVRVSMGGVLRVPYARADAGARAGATLAALASLRAAGFTTIALTPDAGATDIGSFVTEGPPERVALMLGAEGPGLTTAALAAADARVRIPISPAFDSLNVSTAAGIAMHRLTPRART